MDRIGRGKKIPGPKARRLPGTAFYGDPRYIKYTAYMAVVSSLYDGVIITRPGPLVYIPIFAV
jgi:hypothetical protein